MRLIKPRKDNLVVKSFNFLFTDRQNLLQEFEQNIIMRGTFISNNSKLIVKFSYQSISKTLEILSQTSSISKFQTKGISDGTGSV